MADQGFHEIQLSGKQMVFLFMAALVVLVGAFLLGESFGRAVQSDAASDATASADGGAGKAIELPPPTDLKPTDLTYPDALQGTAAAGARATDAGARASTPRAGTSQGAPAPATATPPEPSPTPTGQGPYLQTEAFSTRAAAETALAKLKTLQFPALISEAPAGTPGPTFRVLVGPLASETDLQQMKARLEKEGYHPFPRR